MIYETTTRPREVLEARIELWSRNTGEITFPRTELGTTAGISASCAPRIMKLTGNTSDAAALCEKQEKGAYFL